MTRAQTLIILAVLSALTAIPKPVATAADPFPHPRDVMDPEW